MRSWPLVALERSVASTRHTSSVSSILQGLAQVAQDLKVRLMTMTSQLLDYDEIFLPCILFIYREFSPIFVAYLGARDGAQGLSQARPGL